MEREIEIDGQKKRKKEREREGERNTIDYQIDITTHRRTDTVLFGHED